MFSLTSLQGDAFQNALTEEEWQEILDSRHVVSIEFSEQKALDVLDRKVSEIFPTNTISNLYGLSNNFSNKMQAHALSVTFNELEREIQNITQSHIDIVNMDSLNREALTYLSSPIGYAGRSANIKINAYESIFNTTYGDLSLTQQALEQALNTLDDMQIHLILSPNELVQSGHNALTRARDTLQTLVDRYNSIFIN